jgi:hypothetical protein
MLRSDWVIGRADLQRRSGRTGHEFARVCVAIEAVFARVFAGLDLDQAHR